MKYSLAIIALLGLTNAIQIREEPAAAAAPAPAVDAAAVAAEATKAVKVDDSAAEKAAEPTKPVGETKVAAKIKEILKTEDEKSQEDANKAGQKIDVSNAPEAAPLAPPVLDKDGKEVKPTPLSASEKTRNAVIRVASVGQEAIDN